MEKDIKEVSGNSKEKRQQKKKVATSDMPNGDSVTAAYRQLDSQNFVIEASFYQITNVVCCSASRTSARSLY